MQTKSMLSFPRKINLNHVIAYCSLIGTSMHKVLGV